MQYITDDICHMSDDICQYVNSIIDHTSNIDDMIYWTLECSKALPDYSDKNKMTNGLHGCLQIVARPVHRHDKKVSSPFGHLSGNWRSVFLAFVIKTHNYGNCQLSTACAQTSPFSKLWFCKNHVRCICEDIFELFNSYLLLNDFDNQYVVGDLWRTSVTTGVLC